MLILDVDGTIRHGPTELGRFVNTPDDVVMFPDAVDRMREWKTTGGRIVVATNQGGVALGYLSVSDCNAALLHTLALADGLVDAVAMCTHHPAAADPEQGPCWCRKPSPGLVFSGVAMLMKDHPGEFYPPGLALMVGDRPEDEQCAQRAGVRFMWADEWRAGERAI
ncbi:MAG: HAD-IIIA family hydrolase [Pseudonocardiaceae bacterium]